MATININGDPVLISQLFPMFAWINSCAFHKGISEFKVRIDNSEKDFRVEFNFNDTILNNQFEQFLNIYNKYNTIQINPIFHLGLPYGIANKDVEQVKENLK